MHGSRIYNPLAALFGNFLGAVRAMRSGQLTYQIWCSEVPQQIPQRAIRVKCLTGLRSGFSIMSGMRHLRGAGLRLPQPVDRMVDPGETALRPRRIGARPGSRW